jgi:hypothetical protein
MRDDPALPDVFPSLLQSLQVFLGDRFIVWRRFPQSLQDRILLGFLEVLHKAQGGMDLLLRKAVH